jgi:hypothetical protein
MWWIVALLIFFGLRVQFMQKDQTQNGDTKLEMIMRYGDPMTTRYFLENHRHDTAVCYLCTGHIGEDSCNRSSSLERKNLCLDILQHCRVVCRVT